METLNTRQPRLYLVLQNCYELAHLSVLLVRLSVAISLNQLSHDFECLVFLLHLGNLNLQITLNGSTGRSIMLLDLLLHCREHRVLSDAFAELVAFGHLPLFGIFSISSQG